MKFSIVAVVVVLGWGVVLGQSVCFVFFSLVLCGAVVGLLGGSFWAFFVLSPCCIFLELGLWGVGGCVLILLSVRVICIFSC